MNRPVPFDVASEVLDGFRWFSMVDGFRSVP